MNDNEKWMSQACEEALKAQGLTSPNPIVGAVCVKNNKLISKGFHKKAGQPHAEIECFKNGKNFQDATLFVTLEPCSTQGRTPPCTEAIIAAGIKKVVIGCLDPNPSHAGKGVKILEQHGIEVVHGVLAEKCWQMNLPFFKWITTQKPLVTLKMAMTLDGKIATKNGQSQWITGEAAREEVQKLRKNSDAVIVGGETVRCDNPSLKVKDSTFPKQPQRYIWSSQKDWDKNLKCFENDGKSALVINPKTTEEWETELKKMAKNNLTSLLIEGGGELAANALQAGIVDEVIFFIAPKILMGRESRPVIGGTSPDSLMNCLNLQNVQSQFIGEDILIKGFLSNIWQYQK